ncbi:TIGR03084 family metal-binding protein [Alterisphingorhabdus coralli]|uniref:TIGR03084 family metal-binding protein n=1 Tax=Alterisphingorhabdus coralli TaxID=3071408 RepID=A0AA97F7C7_9SPHN|nr:TIGR03084 family metal-binding protein [Parasphingorhabdus sp. SCSIO 66989]WOE73870.1 TIGR03084 family metal-binding protein [Parasphingorhabdus sp. SCSIO 66989]
MQEAEDFRQESRALYALLKPVDNSRFAEKTQFNNWAINDVLQHLHFWNDMARFQIEDEALLQTRLKELMESGSKLRQFESATLGDLGGNALLDAWEVGFERMADLFAQADPKRRLIWAGPSMSARSSVTARLMETWAHGQEIYDHLGVERENTDRIRGIVVLGVNTFGWIYKARKEEPPEKMPKLELTAPSGEVWRFGEDYAGGLIVGSAAEFCQVVTQTRNIADTRLMVRGDIAKDWMSKAQCFAGPPITPPKPGARFRQTA